MSVGAVAVEVNATSSMNKHVKSKVEEVDLVESIDFLEIGGYAAKESVNDVAIRDNLSHEQRDELMDLASGCTRGIICTGIYDKTDLVSQKVIKTKNIMDLTSLFANKPFHPKRFCKC